ncbi:hypothetical protein [Paenibacillus polymyxa]|uniref:hypothetical protein n=1 Tax=Paenibacillus polymyxa TaxID=1406 RepID=UPI001F2C47BD|nr:hypothetical protein [Paenibacillus polymyxa]
MNASITDDVLALEGSVTDQSDIAQLKVYVNGIRVVITEDKANWSARFQLLIQTGWCSQADTLHILVLAKDIYGNTSAQVKSVTLPNDKGHHRTDYNCGFPDRKIIISWLKKACSERICGFDSEGNTWVFNT